MIETFDEFRAESCQRLAPTRLCWRVGQIGQQREMEITVVVCERTDFEVVDDLANLLFVQQERRNCHQGGA